VALAPGDRKDRRFRFGGGARWSWRDIGAKLSG
jgi:hypothetical protein